MSSIKMNKRWYNEKYKEIYEQYDGKYIELVEAYVRLLWKCEVESGNYK